MGLQDFKKTKIVATIGPASESEEKLHDMIKAGVNVARLNFSHGTQQDHKERIIKIRTISKKLGKPVAILQDLQGAKIRLGNLKENSMFLKKGQIVKLGFGKEQETDVLPVQIDIFPFLEIGHHILINDGIIRLVVEDLTDGIATAKVLASGEIKPHKGINLPHTQLPNMSLTEKDKEDLEFGLANAVDYVAVSFVQSAQDLQYVRKLMGVHAHQPKLVAKIECGPAVKNLDEIIQEADAVMVARGDLAVEVGQEEVPIIQRTIIRKMRSVHKPVIVATQMLESMIKNAEPTRAEVNDVATAVLDQVDAVMLSAESAHGEYPLESVEMMEKIIKRVERYLGDTQQNIDFKPHKSHRQVDAIASAASVLALELDAKLILAVTESGVTAQELSSFRPSVPILAVTDNNVTYNQLALLWGVKAFFVPKIIDNDEAYETVLTKLKGQHLIEQGDIIVHVAGTHPGVSGHINSIKVAHVEGD